MARERDYLSNAEYDEAVRRFYNGLNYTEHIIYKENIIDQLKINPRVVEEYLIGGERYTLLDRGYCITSYGRVFNLRFRRFLTPKFYNSDIYIYCGQDSYKLQPIFNEMGWKFDKVEILRKYLKEDWSRKVMDNCRYAHLAE